MATRLIAEYLTAGGTVVTVQEKSGFFTLYTVTSACGGCRGGIARHDEDAEADVTEWAAGHAVTCRRLPQV